MRAKLYFSGLILCFCCTYGQLNHGGLPLTFTQEYVDGFHNNSSRQSNASSVISTYSLPNLNKNKKQNDSSSSTIVGEKLNVDIDILAISSVQYLEDSSKLFLLKVASPTAGGLSFYFDKYQLPFGGRLFIYSTEKDMLLGSFTEANNRNDLKFVTQPLNGDTIYIEYLEPYGVNSETKLHLNFVGHIYDKPFQTGGSLTNGRTIASMMGCEVDVACPDGLGWEHQASSVALYFYDDLYSAIHLGTGALINNVAQDGWPYFLTANHVVTEATLYGYDVEVNIVVANAVFIFNYKNKTCGGNDYDGTYFGIPYTSQSVYGATVVARDRNQNSSDYMLLDLTPGLTAASVGASNVTADQAAQIFAQWRVCYSGWNFQTSYSTPPLYCIHHPGLSTNGTGSIQPQKISTCNQIGQPAWIPNSPSGLPNPYNGVILTWDVDANGDPIHGITEKGSSGAPLFNSLHQIIGQCWGCG